MHADSVTIEDKHTDYINSKGHLWSLIRKRLIKEAYDVMSCTV